MHRRVAGAIVLSAALLAAGCSDGGGGDVVLPPLPPTSSLPAASGATADAATTDPSPTSIVEAPAASIEPPQSTLAIGAPTTVAGPVPTPPAEASGNEILVRGEEPIGAFDRRLLGTNVPAWLGPERLGDPEWAERVVALGSTVLRFPGGSWSGDYDWLGCENDDESTCAAAWAARPTDVADFLSATGAAGMWTVSFNGTAQEAAALVAFFNGSADDATVIGVDRRGRDWATVGDWARLRAEHGHPDPVPIEYWEIGNEVYGATSEAKGDCADFGWEHVWTCDGTDYVEGDDEHDGFLAFREAMRAVDPSIQIGAVGVSDQQSWSDWGNEVIAGAGDVIDFYVVHHYGFNDEPAIDEMLGEPRSAWPAIMSDVDGAFAERHPPGEVPVAITEFNLVAFLDIDSELLMTTAANAFYLAETIGQLAVNGVDMANQWNLANGRADNGSDYGLLDADTAKPYPSYYAMALWSRFTATELVATDTELPLSVYAGRRADGGIELFVINPTEEQVDAAVRFGDTAQRMRASVDVAEMSALDGTAVTFNGSAAPSADLSEPPGDLGVAAGTVEHGFPPLSLTVLHLSPVPD